MITTLIEKYLIAIDQATFQKLMNHLLFLDGYKFIGSPGSVIGKNKTSKGTPDSFFEDRDNLVFCELTTQERLENSESFFKKLGKDIDHCFNEAQTNVSKNKISKIILGFTDKLKPDEFLSLKARAAGHNPKTELVLYSIQEIPFRILYYPGFAEKYFPGVKTTKGTLYTLPDFLATTTKGLQPSLVNLFVGRDDEIKKAKEFLANSDILVLTGVQGVGKSKLGVHLLDHLETEGFEPRVIVSSPVELWDDLQTFILPDKKYAILFDDANKALVNLDYLLQFIDTRNAGSTKVIITVRDYVKHEISRFIHDKRFSELSIDNFKQEKVNEIVRGAIPNGFVLDPYYLDRIISLANGNARLALMALKSIQGSTSQNFLDNVVNLYDHYFKKIDSEVSFLKDKKKLTALGILSFFTAINRNDKVLADSLNIHFGINWDDLWETFTVLEQNELIDLYSNEIAKVSDQVLSTYVFFKTFFDLTTATIPYDMWVLTYIEKYDKKIERSLYDGINTFGFHETKDLVLNRLGTVQDVIQNNSETAYKFYSIFWIYKEADTLLFLREWVDSLEQHNYTEKDIVFTYEHNNHIWAPKYFELLLNFWRHQTQYIKEALKIGFQIVFKQPSRLPEFLKHLNEHLPYHRFDYKGGYNRQYALLDLVTQSGYNRIEQVIVNNIFLSIAGQLLGWEFHEINGDGNGAMTIYHFHLVKTEKLSELRQMILRRSFDLFINYPEKVLVVLRKYIWPTSDIDASVYVEEQELVSAFLERSMKNDVYTHCKLVKEYVGKLRKNGAIVTHNWDPYLTNELMTIAEIVLPSFGTEGRLSYEEQEIKKQEQIENLIKDKDLSSIILIFKSIEKLYGNDNWQIEVVLRIIFNKIAKDYPTLFLQTIEHVTTTLYPFSYDYGSIIFYPVKEKLVDLKSLYIILSRGEYPQKQFWKYMFFEALPVLEITDFFFLEFIGFVHSINTDFQFYCLDSFIKYNPFFGKYRSGQPNPQELPNNIVVFITAILINKTDKLNISFDQHVCEKCGAYFTSNIQLIKKLYFYNKSKENSYDYNGAEMKAVSFLSPFFLIEYLEEKTKDVEFLHLRFDNLNLDFIWDIPEYEDVLDKAMDVIIPKAPLFSDMEHQANVLFKKNSRNEMQEKNALAYISKFIQKNSGSQQRIAIILNVVMYSFNQHLLGFLKNFLLLNKDPEILSILFLHRSNVISGSRVPSIDLRISFLKKVIEMVKSLPDPLDYRNHLKRWENEITYLIEDKEREKKNDFVGWVS